MEMSNQMLKSLISENSNSSNKVGQFLIRCNEFGSSSWELNPEEGVMVGEVERERFDGSDDGLRRLVEGGGGVAARLVEERGFGIIGGEGRI
ncbi:hypothetical protein LINPERHAP1_LOCUS4661 [Linum perenne]